MSVNIGCREHTRSAFKKIFHAKAQRAQSAAAFLKGFLCAFAPLREKFFMSEIKPIDILFVEDERQAQPHFIINHFNLAQSSGAYLVVAAFHFAFG